MPDFTKDWFTNNIPLWEKQLMHLKGKPLTFLEIGTFEGRSALWLLENILTHKDSRLYCVDSWKDATVYKRFMKNIAPYEDKVAVLRGMSSVMLRGIKKEMFDFVYIDASKHSQNVLEEAVMSFPLVKPGGLIVFDDYTHNKEHDINCPRPGIDAFMNVYATEIKVLVTRWQVIAQKRRVPLKRRYCFSEFYREPASKDTYKV